MNFFKKFSFIIFFLLTFSGISNKDIIFCAQQEGMTNEEVQEIVNDVQKILDEGVGVDDDELDKLSNDISKHLYDDALKKWKRRLSMNTALLVLGTERCSVRITKSDILTLLLRYVESNSSNNVRKKYKAKVLPIVLNKVIDKKDLLVKLLSEFESQEKTAENKSLFRKKITKIVNDCFNFSQRKVCAEFLTKALVVDFCVHQIAKTVKNTFCYGKLKHLEDALGDCFNVQPQGNNAGQATLQDVINKALKAYTREYWLFPKKGNHKNKRRCFEIGVVSLIDLYNFIYNAPWILRLLLHNKETQAVASLLISQTSVVAQDSPVVKNIFNCIARVSNQNEANNDLATVLLVVAQFFGLYSENQYLDSPYAICIKDFVAHATFYLCLKKALKFYLITYITKHSGTLLHILNDESSDSSHQKSCDLMQQRLREFVEHGLTLDSFDRWRRLKLWSFRGIELLYLLCKGGAEACYNLFKLIRSKTK